MVWPKAVFIYTSLVGKSLAAAWCFGMQGGVSFQNACLPFNGPCSHEGS